MEKRGGPEGFAPVFTAASRALVLGTYPSPKSLEAGFFYGHPQNRFWTLLATLAGRDVPKDTQEKAGLIRETGLALWDILESCTILGASDASITDAVPNDIAGLIAKTQVEAVFCNGAAAHRFYKRFAQRQTGIEALRLPSTSPANAAWSFERLLDAWAPLKACMLL